MAGTLVADTLQDGAGNSTAMDNAIYGSAKAWVNFNGTSGASPVIRASYNVSSVTRNGTGNYTVTYTNAFIDGNYVITTCAGGSSGNSSYLCLRDNTVPTTTSAIFGSNNVIGTANVDQTYCYVACFR